MEEGRRDEEGRSKGSVVGRFLGWVNADIDLEEEGFDEENEEDEHREHEYEEHDEDEDEEEVAPIADDALLEDYEGDDEFDYPDEIIIRDEASEADDEIDYADTAPAYQQTVHMTKKQKTQMRRFRVFYLALSAVVAINVIGVLLLTVNYLPPFGAADNPAVNEVYTRYVEHGVAETGALNIVSAVLYAYRSFDTLGEAFVLFTAAIGVILLMRETKGEEAD